MDLKADVHCEGFLRFEWFLNNMSLICSSVASGLVEYKVFCTLLPLLNSNSSLWFLPWLSTMAHISSSHGRHLSGLDPSNLSIFLNALFVQTFMLLSSLHIFSHSSFQSLHCLCASSFSLMNLKYSHCSCNIWLTSLLLSEWFDWTDRACCCHWPWYGGGMYSGCAKSWLACGTWYWLYCWLKVCSVGGLTCWLTCDTSGVCLWCWPWKFYLYCGLLTVSIGIDDPAVDWLCCNYCWGDGWVKCGG